MLRSDMIGPKGHPIVDSPPGVSMDFSRVTLYLVDRYFEI